MNVYRYTYYIPLPEEYNRRELNALYREIPLKDTASRLLRKYFNAAANLYGIVPLEKHYEIIVSQNRSPVFEEEFLAFAEIAKHECGDYYILGKSDLYYDGPKTPLMEYEIVGVELLDEDMDDYHELLRSQQGKPYYVPPKREFLLYDDLFYVEATEEAVALHDFLLTKTEVRGKCEDSYLEDIWQEICWMVRCTDIVFSDVIDFLNEMDVVFKRQKDMYAFAEIYTQYHNHARMWCNRAHTPSELAAMAPPEERVPKSLTFGPNIRKAIAEGDIDGADLRKQIMSMELPNEMLRQSLLKEIGSISNTPSPPQKVKVGRNDPCPCGSGKKYKKCCGR